MTDTIDTKSLNKKVRAAILAEDRRLRSDHTWLKYQDLIGASIMLAIVLWIAAFASAYLTDLIPAWVAVVGVALAMSIAHEMEHDLIHSLYFAGHKALYKAAMGSIWLIKLHANPYWRRKVHLHHHGFSGQDEDWEERLLGMGQPMGLRRMIGILYPFGQIFFLRIVKKRDPKFDVPEAMRANTPGWILFHGLAAAGILSLTLPDGIVSQVDPIVWKIVQALNVLWVIPSIVRHATLTLITTAVHYCDDTPRNDVHYENQILDHWMYLPAQIFCFNFGSTHIVHHYFSQQPFYIRQMAMTRIKPVLLEAGARHNDLGILARANKWAIEPRST